jgi:sugar phosphate isomerase/epimerase
MRYYTLWLLLLFFLGTGAQETQKLRFYQTNWGNELSWDAFCGRTKASGYDGIEVWLPNDPESQEQLKNALEKYGLRIGFLNGTDKSIPFDQSLEAYTAHLKKLIAWKPDYINCHTGSDFFSFEENRAFIAAADRLAAESGIPIYHETHRGRFSYTLPQTLAYLEAITDLKLNLDISHWMVVHESLLEGKEDVLKTVIDRSHHIHARVGHAEGPQVNDPEAPEWKRALGRHLDIWEQVIRKQWSASERAFTITTEFGPADYMPTLPYTRLPVADQWKANLFIMKALKERLDVE